ncbi:glutathione synthetase [[Candida] railenensis]|uniref:Glutathione synthetase n=1 Tax=[Candida] railenensis TaxID=45579 RepID=A0A9P0QTG0_9ASCO|nr:glutathione synthetase [[Candida] railenensis]
MPIKPFPDLNEAQKLDLIERLQQWSLSNGLVMYPPNFKSYSAAVAPITLFPTPFPKKSFHNALEVQKTFNELYINLVTKEKSWLLEILDFLAPFDKTFTGKLYEIYQESQKLGVKQPLSLGVFRSDYMVNDIDNVDQPEIKQIEFNTVSVSFGGLSSKVGKLHNYLNRSGCYDNEYSYQYYEDGEIPVSNSINELAQGLANADSTYSSTATSILFVVQPGERNCFDQRHIEYSLLENHNIKSFRVTLEDVQDYLTVNGDKLYVKSSMDEISVVYYRSGYAPSDYEISPEKTWGARLFLEDTTAIKCPSLLTQLSGSKKVQQLLTNEEIIKKLLPAIESKELAQVLSTFVSIYPLDSSEQGKIAKKLAFEKPELFVLKPQREGGGNNIYKENIPDFLKSIDEEEWGAYILMELINPSNFKNKIIRNDETFNEEIISELGVFGTILFNEVSGEILENENAGWLLRSKFSSSNEGGVAAGFGCVDNIYLY